MRAIWYHRILESVYEQAVYIEILRSQSDISHVSILFQLYDLPETSIDNDYGTTLKSNLIHLSVEYDMCTHTLSH